MRYDILNLIEYDVRNMVEFKGMGKNLLVRFSMVVIKINNWLMIYMEKFLCIVKSY